MSANAAPVIAAVIPCYRVKRHILSVIEAIGAEVDRIYVVDDACPEGSGRHVAEQLASPRLEVIYHPENRGVGAATLTGFSRAVADGADILVKVDGDGQMDPAILNRFTAPLLSGAADYAKGNRFYNPADIKEMPLGRIGGNAVLSFLSKLSSGYWNLFDPTNGYVAIHRSVFDLLPSEKIAPRYLFESDMLFHLSLLRALVVDVPMPARYGTEKSNMAACRQIPIFLLRHLGNAIKRIFYNYYLRDFNVASLELLCGLALFCFGGWFGVTEWIEHSRQAITASSGTVMLAALPVILGFQLLLSFINYDVRSVPTRPLNDRRP